MKIQTTKTHTQRLHDREIMEEGYDANFNDEGVAEVKQEVGEQLVEKNDAISEVNDE